MKQRNVSIIVYSTILILSTLILFLLLFSYREKIDEIFVSDNIVIGKDCRTNKYAFYTKQNNKYTKLREIEHNSTDKYFTLNTNPKIILACTSNGVIPYRFLNNKIVEYGGPSFSFEGISMYSPINILILLGESNNLLYFIDTASYKDNFIYTLDVNSNYLESDTIVYKKVNKKDLPKQILEAYKNVATLKTKIDIRTSDRENYAKTEKKFSTYNNPIIPEGFHKVETKEASWKIENGIPIGWDNGLVIEDNNGNQFVWVPVNLDEYKNCAYLIDSNLLFNENNMEYNRDYDYQVMKYGGFYISRYEIGKFEDETNLECLNAISMPGKNVFNNLKWEKAKQWATVMYKTDKLQSDLVSPKEWITMCKWIEKHGYDMIDSSDYGNYLNTEGKLNLTGSNEKYKTCNIYDVAGNVREYTDRHPICAGEPIGYNFKFIYGGSYAMPGYYSASSRSHYQEDSTDFESIGFRVVLYIKNSAN